MTTPLDTITLLFNRTCQWYSHLSAINAPISPALGSLSQTIEMISSLDLIVPRIIIFIGKFLAALYALGFSVTALALVGFLGSPGGRVRTIISVILSWVSPTLEVRY